MDVYIIPLTYNPGRSDIPAHMHAVPALVVLATHRVSLIICTHYNLQYRFDSVRQENHSTTYTSWSC